MKCVVLNAATIARLLREFNKDNQDQRKVLCGLKYLPSLDNLGREWHFEICPDGERGSLGILLPEHSGHAYGPDAIGIRFTVLMSAREGQHSVPLFAQGSNWAWMDKFKKEFGEFIVRQRVLEYYGKPF